MAVLGAKDSRRTKSVGFFLQRTACVCITSQNSIEITWTDVPMMNYSGDLTGTRKEGGTITLRLRINGACWVVTVKDGIESVTDSSTK